MAFVRWRGSSAQLLATVYENGRSRQVTLTSLPGFYASETIRRQVAERFPQIKVDWAAVDRSLAQGPPSGILKQSIPPGHLDYVAVEHYLRQWANDAEEANLTGDANKLRIAAEVLTEWRARFYWDNECKSKM